MQFYLKMATHTQTHTQMKINPDVWQRTSAAREGGELRSQFFRVPERWREGMLHGGAPVNGRTARSTAARMETVSVKEPGSSRAESEAGIRAAARTLRETRSRLRRLPSSLTLETNDPQRVQPLHDLPPFFRYQPTNCLTPTLRSRRLTFQLTLKTTHFLAHQTTLVV